MARPIGFKRNGVLDKAMNAFWSQGFNATSMATLTDLTELGSGSIYAAFQSKEGLFLATLDHYGELSVASVEHALSALDSPLQSIHAYFRSLAQEIVQPQAQRGCYLVNTVLELASLNPTVQARVNHYFATIEALFYNALKRAQDRGELAPDRDLASLSIFLMTNIWGLRVLAGTGPQSARAEAVVEQILSLLV